MTVLVVAVGRSTAGGGVIGTPTYDVASGIVGCLRGGGCENGTYQSNDVSTATNENSNGMTTRAPSGGWTNGVYHLSTVMISPEGWNGAIVVPPSGRRRCARTSV